MKATNVPRRRVSRTRSARPSRRGNGTRQDTHSSLDTAQLEDTHIMYVREAVRWPVLKPEEERELARRIREEGDPEARERLAAHNYRLVLFVANGYRNRGLEFPDLIQEGNIGLLKAIERFDERKGYRFSTYAIWWIRQEVTRAIANSGRTIRIPVHQRGEMFQIRRAVERFATRHGREPTPYEVAEVCGLSVERVQKSLDLLAGYPIASLDRSLSCHDDDGDTLHETLADPHVPLPDHVASVRSALEWVERTVQSCAVSREQVNTRNLRIFRMCFGLDDGNPKTLTAVGRAFGITRERVRQICSRIWLRLERHGVDRETVRPLVLEAARLGLFEDQTDETGAEE